ncbi:hypothetical protein DFH06DRAFT_1122122 [Mycena polygramma]|nr:hypothetical protein DFH06DRAFT_1122122 [Mycena polygramma]
MCTEDPPTCLQPVRQSPSSQATKTGWFRATFYDDQGVGIQETKTVSQDTYLLVKNTGVEFQVGTTYRLQDPGKTHDCNKAPNLGIGEELSEGQLKDEPRWPFGDKKSGIARRRLAESRSQLLITESLWQQVWLQI